MTSVTDILGPPPPAGANTTASSKEGAAPASGGAVPNGKKPHVADILGARHGGSGNFDVDTDTGLPMVDRRAIMAADNTAEKLAYLEKVYGKENVTTNWAAGGGRPQIIVTHNGKKYDAETGGTIAGLAADTVAHTPELVGMGVGATLGSATGIPLAGYAGAALGGAVGKGIEELAKGAEGGIRKSPGQESTALMEAGGGAALAEGGGRFAGAVIKKVAKGGLPEAITGTTEAIKDQFRKMKAVGGRPPVQSVMPDMTKFARMEIMAEKLGGAATGRNAANRAVLEKMTKQTLRDSGVPETFVDDVYNDLKSGRYNVSGESAGEMIQKRVQAHIDMLNQRTTDQMDHATASTKEQIKHFEVLSKRYPKGALGVDVGEGITAARKGVATTANKIYDHIDEMLGDKPIVDAHVFRRMAAQYAKGLPENTVKLLDDILKIEPIDVPGSKMTDAPQYKITLGQAQRFRTLLGDLAGDNTLTPGTKEHELAVVRKVLDQSITNAGKDLENKPAIDLLRKADAWYKENIRMFSDHKLASIIDQWKTGLNPTPTSMVHVIMDAGNIERTMALKKVVGPDVWKRVQAEDINALLAESRTPLRADIVDGQSLAKSIFERREMMEAVHGKKETERMFQFARNLASTQGKLPASELQGGHFKTIMEEYEKADAQLEAFVKNDPIAALGAMKARPAAVYAKLTKPENAKLLGRVIEFLGPKSPEVAELRQTALNQALQESVYDMNTNTEMSKSLETYLSKFSKEQQELLFPNGTADALRELGKNMEFLFPQMKDPSMAGMTTGAIMQRMFIRRWWAQGMSLFGRFVISHPGFQEYIIGTREPGKVAKTAQVTSMQFARLFAAQAVQGVDEPDDGHGQETVH